MVLTVRNRQNHEFMTLKQGVEVRAAVLRQAGVDPHEDFISMILWV